MEIRRFGRYEAVRLLGEGGMAAVWLARDPALRREVAVKVLKPELGTDPDGIRRFQDEAGAVARLGGTHVVQVYDFGREGDADFLVMEYVPGWSLLSLLPPGTGIAPETAAAVAIQAAEGLAEAHRAGIVHRDVKPDNLLVRHDGLLKVADFGIARLVEEVSRTRTGSVFGSPLFMAPEQIRGEKPTPAIDAFALGGMLYRLLSGRHPFEAEHAQAAMWRIVSEDPPDIAVRVPGLPAELVVLVRLLLAKNPERRPALAEVAAVLRRFLSGCGIQDPATAVRDGLIGDRPPPVAAGSPTPPSQPSPRPRTAPVGTARRARPAWLVPGLVATGILLAVALLLVGRALAPRVPDEARPATSGPDPSPGAARGSASGLVALAGDEAPGEANTLKPRLAVRNDGRAAVDGFRVAWDLPAPEGFDPVVETWWAPGCAASVERRGDSLRLAVDCPDAHLEPGATHPSPDGMALGLHDRQWRTWDGKASLGLDRNLAPRPGLAARPR